jgi:glycosyltransferase involved in cell wall biosynthesis
VQKPLILFNDNLVSPNFRGMRRYFTEIIHGAAVRFGRNLLVYAPLGKNLNLAHQIQAVQFRGQQPLRMNQAIVSGLVIALRPKVLFNAYYTDICTAGHEVFTVYDMIPELMPQYFPYEHPGNQKFIDQKRRSLERASLIFAISTNTAQDLRRVYPHLDASRVLVTPLGVDATFFEPQQQLKSARRPYFLYVGHRGRHKNFTRLLAAFAQSGLAPQYELIVVSPGDFSPEERARIQNHHLADSVHSVPSASDTTLRSYYHQAVGLVYPSEYEGFGLPILEAMASGTLVATSRTSSMVEVGGTAAFYFDPLSVPSIAEMLIHVANLDDATRQQRTAQGAAHAKTFTWERCVQQTVDGIQKLL